MLTKKGTKALASIIVAPETGVSRIQYDHRSDTLAVIASVPARDFGVQVKSYHLFIDQGYFKAIYEKADSKESFFRMFRGNDDVHHSIADEDTVEKPSDDLDMFYDIIEGCDKVGEYPCHIEIFCRAPSVRPTGTLPDFAFEDDAIKIEKPTDRKAVEDFITELKTVLPPYIRLLAVWLENGCAGIEWSTKETLDFVPPSPMWEKESATDLYEEDAANGTRTLTVYRLGDKNIREHCKGGLADFFEPWDPDLPEHSLYRLLTEFYGVKLLKVESDQQYWEDLGALGDDPELPWMPDEWSLVEDTETPWPLHQRVCMYAKDTKQISAQARVYTRTDLDDDRGREGLCEVYADWNGFLAGPEPDLVFKDTEENRDLLLKALPNAWDMAMCHPNTTKKTFLDTLRKKMGEAIVDGPVER